MSLATLEAPIITERPPKLAETSNLQINDIRHGLQMLFTIPHARSITLDLGNMKFHNPEDCLGHIERLHTTNDPTISNFLSKVRQVLGDYMTYQRKPRAS